MMREIAAILITVAAIFPTLAGSLSKDTFLKISVECPSDQDPRILMISENILGGQELVEVSYKEGAAVTALLAARDKGGVIETIASVDVGHEKDAGRLLFAKVIFRRAEADLRSACQGSASQKAAFRAMLAQNRARLRAGGR